MYKCEKCGKIVPPSIPATRLVIKTRTRRYPERIKANKFRQAGKNYERNDHGGSGSEIAREMTVCPQCAEDFAREASKT